MAELHGCRPLLFLVHSLVPHVCDLQHLINRLYHSLQSLFPVYQLWQYHQPFGYKCMKRHLTSHPAAELEQHQNANHQEKRHTPPPSTSPLSTSTPTILYSLSAVSSDRDVSIPRGVRGLLFVSFSREEGLHGATNSRGKLQTCSGSANSTPLAVELNSPFVLP